MPPIARITMILERLAVATALAIPLVVLPAMAQTLTPDPGPEEPRVPEMMRMLHEMRAEMDQMHEAMAKPDADDAAMRERMGGMRGRMGRMTEMMERHDRALREQCPGMKTAPKSGG